MEAVTKLKARKNPPNSPPKIFRVSISYKINPKNGVERSNPPDLTSNLRYTGASRQFP